LDLTVSGSPQASIQVSTISLALVFPVCSIFTLTAFWEGEDTDPDSQLSHITKAISALIVLRDAMIQNNWTDDRPPRSKQTPAMVSEQYKQMLERLKSLQPDPVEGYTQKGIDDAK